MFTKSIRFTCWNVSFSAAMPGHHNTTTASCKFHFVLQLNLGVDAQHQTFTLYQAVGIQSPDIFPLLYCNFHPSIKWSSILAMTTTMTKPTTMSGAISFTASAGLIVSLVLALFH
ncbi:hypothetical protein AWC38_SpisGene16328 [Stylophora pistillata]|uniref:Uncharacterized protein n=1 Tax=Stylophora pistillata TaxID=50429 RepID=A0A2B4RSC7_STYPI|nr:hypothetical protein AWC38_SpisGene16328 [Stylophora pistillata]